MERDEACAADDPELIFCNGYRMRLEPGGRFVCRDKRDKVGQQLAAAMTLGASTTAESTPAVLEVSEDTFIFRCKRKDGSWVFRPQEDDLPFAQQLCDAANKGLSYGPCRSSDPGAPCGDSASSKPVDEPRAASGTDGTAAKRAKRTDESAAADRQKITWKAGTRAPSHCLRLLCCAATC